MTDAPTATSRLEDVRAAAAAVKSAIDRHLAAVEARTGEGDLAVQDAYTDLHDAAERYDDLLFETYDEVTPFVLTEPPHAMQLAGAEDQDGDAEPAAVSMLARWELEIVDRDAVIEAGRAAIRKPWMQAAEEAADFDQASDLSLAFSQLIDVYGRDELAERADDFGLARLGVTTWLVAGDEVADDDEWMETAFSDVDDQRLIYRVDEVEEDAEDADEDQPAI